MKPEETLEAHIIAKIKKSGYPLEIEISNLLEKDYVVFNTQYYFDEESKQGRDIDIFAHSMYFDLDKKLRDLDERLLPFKVRTEPAIECKKSEKKPWVFFSVEKYFGSGKDDFFPFLKYNCDLNDYFQKREENPLLELIEGKITFHHYSDSSTPKCINYVEAFKTKEKKEQIL